MRISGLKATLSTNEALNVAVACANLLSGIANADTNADGKTTPAEIGLSLLQNVGSISTIATQSKAAYLSFRAFNVSQRREVIAAFGEYFDLPNDKAEEQIEVVLLEANEIVSSVAKIVAKFKKEKALQTEGE